MLSGLVVRVPGEVECFYENWTRDQPTGKVLKMSAESFSPCGGFHRDPGLLHGLPVNVYLGLGSLGEKLPTGWL